MTFYEKLEKYLERGLHVLARSPKGKTYCIFSPFMDSSSNWRTTYWESAPDNCLRSIGNCMGGGKNYEWNDGNFEIIRTYTPEELNPKFKRYEVGDKVVWNDEVWTIGRVLNNGTYTIEQLVDGLVLRVRDLINHYDLKPYIEDDGKAELNIVIDIKKETDVIRKEIDEKMRALEEKVKTTPKKIKRLDENKQFSFDGGSHLMLDIWNKINEIIDLLNQDKR